MFKKIIRLFLICGLILLNKSYANENEVECIKTADSLPENSLVLVDENGCLEKIFLNVGDNDEIQASNFQEVRTETHDSASRTGSWNVFSSK